MSTSADERRLKAKRDRTTAAFYLAVSAFCALFGSVYESFSHGVYSPFMVFAFAIPLVLGAAAFFALSFTAIAPCGLARRLYHSGVATLTVGSVFEGVVEIYGTDSPLAWAYLAAGVLMLAAAVAAALRR